MKMIQKTIILALSAFLLINTSCNQLDEVGYSILPDDDKIDIIASDTNSVLIKNILPNDSLNSFRVSNALLGSYIDPLFGKTTAGFVTEFRHSYTAFFTKDSLELDSIVLFLAYTDTTSAGYYGDSSTNMEFSMHLLTQTLDTIPVPSNSSMEGKYNPLPLATFNLKIKPDTNIVELKLPNSFGEAIMELDSLVRYSDYKDQFPGFYFKPNSSINSGITKFNLLSSNTRMILYYSKGDSAFQAGFLMDEYCINFNLFEHDYNGKEILTNVNSAALEDSVIYLQSMNGVRATITIDNPSQFYGKIINLAEITFPLYQTSGYLNYSPISNLILLTEDKSGNLSYITEYSTGGLSYDDDLMEYTFNITRYLQSIANQDEDLMPYIYLVPTYDKIDLARVVLDNRANSVKLKVKYINQ
jgi:hypothetical protein